MAGGGEPHKKEQTRFTIFFVLIVPLGIAAQRWLFQQADEVSDPQWELYQQRYD